MHFDTMPIKSEREADGIFLFSVVYDGDYKKIISF